MRTFIALELPADFQDEVAALSRGLRETIKGRFIPRENYHITLAFLGDVGEGDIAGATDALNTATSSTSSIPLYPDGLGKFGKAEDSTLWLGLREEPALMGIAATLRQNLDDHLIFYDPKPFKPHITLARRVQLPKGQLGNLAFPNPANALALTLFKSLLTPEGAQYKPLYSVELP